MNKMVKQTSTAGMLTNKRKRGKRHGKWAKGALSKGLTKKQVDTVGMSAHKK